MRNTILALLISIAAFSQNTRQDIEEMKKRLPSANDSLKVELYKDLFSWYRNKNLPMARLYLDSMRTFAKKQNSKMYVAKVAKYEGTYFAMKNDYRRSEDSIRKAIRIYKEIDDLAGLSHSYNNLGLTLRSLGQLDSAMYYHMKSLKIRESLGIKPQVLAQNYTTIGVIHGMLYDYDKADSYFLKAEEIYLNNNNLRLLAGTWNKIALNAINRGDSDKALTYYIKSDSLYASNENLRGRALVQNNLGSLYLELEQYDKARQHCITAQKISEEINNRRYLTTALNNLAVIEIEEGNYEKSIAYVEKAMSLVTETGVRDQNIHHYFNLAVSYAGLGNYEQAYAYRVKHFELYDSIFNAEKTLQINELETKYQTEKKETEIALQQEEINTLNAKAKADQLKKGMYAGGMVSAVVFSGLLVFGFRQRIKKNRIAREKQEAIYQQEIEHKKKELASQTLHLVQKNTFIKELMDNLQSIKNDPERFKVEFRRIVMLLKRENASDKDWEVFKTYFAEVHNDFDQKLMTLYPDISQKEIRLAAFLRMKLTTKEMAATLNVLPDSILKSKYRLKKKLGLDKETDLTAFLNTL